MLTHNDLKEGTEIRLTQRREGTIKDNKKGIIRVVEVAVFGQGFDVGSCYVNEIILAKINGVWESVELSDSHEKQLNKIGWV